MTLTKEARILGRYLVNKDIPQDLADRYAHAIESCGAKLSDREMQLWQMGLKHPYLIPFIDAGLALHQSFSGIRKRIYIMYCVLETTPRYTAQLLPQNRSSLYFIRFCFEMALAVIHSVFGFLFVKLYFYARNN